MVSIITVCYNSEKTIEQTIKSVINQSYTNVEYIVIDGGSSDSTVEIIEKYANKIAYWVSEPDKGIYDAMNKGILAARGEFIGIINSDDWYEPDTISDVISTFKNTFCDIVHADIRFFKNEKPEFILKPLKKMNELQVDMFINHPTCFIRRELYLRYGKFNTDYKIAADYELLLRFYTKGAKFFYLNKTLVNMRAGGISDQNTEGFREVHKISLSYGASKYKTASRMYKEILRVNLSAFLRSIGATFFINLKRKLSNRKVAIK